MNCPFCGFDNIEGIEQCGQCEADLTSVEDSEGSHDIEKDLLSRPLREILATDYLDVSEDTPVGEVVRETRSLVFVRGMIVVGDKTLVNFSAIIKK